MDLGQQPFAEIRQHVNADVLDVDVEDGSDQITCLFLGLAERARLGGSDPGDLYQPPAAVPDGGGLVVVGFGVCHPSHPSGRQGNWRRIERSTPCLLYTSPS